MPMPPTHFNALDKAEMFSSGIEEVACDDALFLSEGSPISSQLFIMETRDALVQCIGQLVTTMNISAWDGCDNHITS